MSGEDSRNKKDPPQEEARIPNYFFLKYLVLNGVTALSYWVTWNSITVAESLIVQAILKFIFYVIVILWINSAFALYSAMNDKDVDSWEFQKEQVKLSLWVLGVLVLMELPIWLNSLSA